MVTAILRWMEVLLIIFLSGCGLFAVGLDIGFKNEKDIPVRLLVDTKVIDLNPNSMIVVSANMTMRICENEMARDIVIDFSEGSPYWKYLRNARINIRINPDNRLRYVSESYKDEGDEVQLGRAFRDYSCSGSGGNGIRS